jgi:alkanesulfonate monooxygenase SsuD/methylene tetrahydromethanopterin reductase-like flavin-dependent oxidoreductase (luciferase family)
VRFGLEVANIGSYSDPHTVVRVAKAAEAAGWELFFSWDHLAFVWGPPAADPWVTLAAVATSTERILIGPGVTPVPRRRPHVVAHQLATLDALSGGRVVFGAGLGGGHGEFRKFGESEDPHDRAPLLDEGLDVIRALLDGGEVTHRGEHFTVDGVTLQPAPGRRLPIWVGGLGRKSRERAARFDGWFADTADARTQMKTSPDELRGLLDGYSFGDVAVLGYSEAGEQDLHDAYADAGATWWIEQIHDLRGDFEAMLARVNAGP